MRRLSFKVSVVRQTSGGGDHVVKYEGMIELSGDKGPVRVEMVSTVPAAVDRKVVQAAVESVQRGAARALAGLAANVRLHHFVIHPTDFRPKKCEQYTFDAVESVLREAR